VTTGLPDPPKQLPDLTVDFITTLSAGMLLLRAHDLGGDHAWSQITRAGAHLSAAAHHLVHPWARKIRASYPQLHGVLYMPSTGGRAAPSPSTSPRLPPSNAPTSCCHDG
jgi:hypothetical protein